MGFHHQVSAQLTIRNTTRADAPGIQLTIRRAFDVPLDEDCDDCMGLDALSLQIKRFPEGQFVAVYCEGDSERIVGTAHTMRVNQPPSPAPWFDVIGSLGIRNHDPQGEWLYGVEMAVHPDYRRRGIGTALYEARFDLVRRLNLKGWYAGGMLMGYENYCDQMSIAEYGEAVLKGEIIDPTVTMQKNRGFELRELILDYMEEPPAGDAAILIVWENPDYRAPS
ncbi:MAG: GNAT family N-acetyltransferase [Anaerolineae bacterium]